MRKLVFIITSFVFILSIAVFALGGTYTENPQVIYQVHKIQYGDTLWNIAENYSFGNINTKEYVKEIMEFNNMENDRIIQGQNIIVPVYKIWLW